MEGLDLLVAFGLNGEDGDGASKNALPSEEVLEDVLVGVQCTLDTIFIFVGVFEGGVVNPASARVLVRVDTAVVVLLSERVKLGTDVGALVVAKSASSELVDADANDGVLVEAGDHVHAFGGDLDGFVRELGELDGTKITERTECVGRLIIGLGDELLLGRGVLRVVAVPAGPVDFIDLFFGSAPWVVVRGVVMGVLPMLVMLVLLLVAGLVRRARVLVALGVMLGLVAV